MRWNATSTPMPPSECRRQRAWCQPAAPPPHRRGLLGASGEQRAGLHSSLPHRLLRTRCCVIGCACTAPWQPRAPLWLPHAPPAPQFMYHAIHRYPARLDAMLLALTRRYLDATPVRTPCAAPGTTNAGRHAPVAGSTVCVLTYQPTAARLRNLSRKVHPDSCHTTASPTHPPACCLAPPAGGGLAGQPGGPGARGGAPLRPPAAAPLGRLPARRVGLQRPAGGQLLLFVP